MKNRLFITSLPFALLLCAQPVFADGDNAEVSVETRVKSEHGGKTSVPKKRTRYGMGYEFRMKQRAERAAKPEHAPRPDRMERPQHAERPEHITRPERVERPERIDRPSRPQRPDRPSRPGR